MGLLAALWGASYMFIKIALDDGLSAPMIVLLRIVLGAAVLVPLAWRAAAFDGLRGRWSWVWAVALVQVAIPFLLITYGERWIPSSLAGILVASTAIFVVLLTPWLAKGDVVSRWGAVGVVVGVTGVGLLFGVDLSGSAKGILGGAMVLVASVFYAIASIWVRTKLGGAQPVGVAAGTMIAAAIASLPAAAAAPPDALPSLGTWAALVGLGAGGTGIAFLLYYTLIADIGAPRAAIVAYIAPGFAVLYGALFLSEPITAATIAGLALILAGSWLGAEGRPPWRPRSSVAPAAREPAAAAVPEALPGVADLSR
jgi:drug/metabolite transporter (DMT)-like permease